MFPIFQLTHRSPTTTIVAVSSTFRLEKEGIKENISYERHVYESVDDESLS